MPNIDKIVLERFTVLYGTPDSTDPQAFVDNYRKAMALCDETRLQRAIDRIVGRHAYSSWPTVGECLNEYRALTAQVVAENDLRLANQPEPPRKEPTEAARKRIDKLLEQHRSFMAKLQEERGPEPLPPTDRDAWENRQGMLLAAGKWCLSRMGRAA